MSKRISPPAQHVPTAKRQILGSYRIAIFIVASLVVLMVCGAGYIVSRENADSELIHTAERQRMWLERVTLATHRLTEESEDNRRAILQILNDGVDQMANSHERLLDEAKSTNWLLPRDLFLNMYINPPLSLDRRVRNFMTIARGVVNMTPREITEKRSQILQQIDLSEEELLPLLSASVQHYDEETRKRLNLLYEAMVVISFMAVMLLVGIAVLLLRPAVTYVAQAQKDLTELNRLKGDFLANMSHEIRTPMNGIFGMTELLIDSGLNSRQQHYTQILQNSADHLLGLINDILDFSKLEAGEMKLDPVQFNLLATMEDTLELMAPRARERGLELLLRYAPSAPQIVTADPGRIRQILFNLVGNAIKFTDSGYIMLHVDIFQNTTTPGMPLWLKVQVEDTGIGIPEDKINALFEKFTQVESGSTRARQGTGLGLAISRNLVQLMGGEISVQRKATNGTIFTWQVPLPAAPESQPQHERNSSLAGKRVLMVDDLAPNRMMFEATLKSAGVECLVAENAAEAMSMLAYEYENKRKVDAVVTDYMMPAINGAQLTADIRSNRRFGELPVMILSSATSRAVSEEFESAGVSAMLSKPVMRQQLLDTLGNMLDASSAGKLVTMMTAESSSQISAKRLLTPNTKSLVSTQILLVEDSRVNLEITTEMLSQLGCQVHTAENGRIALDMVRQRSFDLIFMDCQMPEMDGFEASQRIARMKAAGEVAPMPIIALTANALKGDRERCLESGMDDYLSKPVRKASLEAMLLKWLRDKLDKAANQNRTEATIVPLVKPLASTPTAPIPVIANATVMNFPMMKPDASSKGPPAPPQYGLDLSAYTLIRTSLGAKFPVVMDYFIKDSETFIEHIIRASQTKDYNAAVSPAHTLKSSSRQFGAVDLGDIAEAIEHEARQGGLSGGASFAQLVARMQVAYEDIKPFLVASIETVPA